MIKKFINLVIGNVEQKKADKKIMQQVAMLPKDYQNAYKQIIYYYYAVGGVIDNKEMLKLKTDLLELFISGVENKQTVKELVGEDVASFANDFLGEYASVLKARREQLNQEVKAGLEQL